MTDIFGVYNIRSRISVGLVVLAPLLIQAYMLIPEVRNISSTCVITIITFALSNLMIIVARTNGSKALHKCFPHSLPAQQYLLPEDNTIDKYTKARYYAFFKSRLNGFEITDNATDMKAHSESAIKWLISQTRNSTEFPLITEENTNTPYGESPVSTAMGAYFNKKAYTDPTLRRKYTRMGFWVNIRLIRYPDVLLMAAESANEKGLMGEASGYLEQVRAHARGTLTNVLPKVESLDQSVLREAIRHERRVELGLEPDRFYDLVRWGIAQEVLQAAGKNYQPKNALLPLPQTEIDKSNGVLVQNPDY